MGLQQAFLQINIMMRNSGTTDALLRRHFGKLATMHPAPKQVPKGESRGRPALSSAIPRKDRRAVRSSRSHSDGCDARDCLVYHLEGRPLCLGGLSASFVRSCDIGSMLRRFGFLLVVKPIASLLARMALKRAMRKTLLGKPTIHGVSPLAARLIAERRLVKSKAGGVGSDEQLHKEFDLTRRSFRSSRRTSRYLASTSACCQGKLLNRSSFFAAVAVLQCFAAFPVRADAAGGACVGIQSRAPEQPDDRDHREQRQQHHPSMPHGL